MMTPVNITFPSFLLIKCLKDWKVVIFLFLYEYSGYNKIAIEPEDQEKTNFICLYDTFAFRRMKFGVCNALSPPTSIKRVRNLLGLSGFIGF